MKMVAAQQRSTTTASSEIDAIRGYRESGDGGNGLGENDIAAAVFSAVCCGVIGMYVGRCSHCIDLAGLDRLRHCF